MKMSNILTLGTGEPDFVNENGTKWWLDSSSTRYAQEPDMDGVTLPEVVCYYVEEPNGHRSYVLVDNKLCIPFWEGHTLEGVGVYIDIMKLDKKMKK